MVHVTTKHLNHSRCDADMIHDTRATCVIYIHLLQQQGLDSVLVRSLILNKKIYVNIIIKILKDIEIFFYSCDDRYR